jgi:hypothetical protein
MFFYWTIIAIFIVCVIIYFKIKEDFNNVENEEDSNIIELVSNSNFKNVENEEDSNIIELVSNSNFKNFNINDLQQLFEFNSSNDSGYLSLILNDKNLFNRLFILDRKQILNTIKTINKILEKYITDPNNLNNFWNYFLYSPDNLKNKAYSLFKNSKITNIREFIIKNKNFRLLLLNIFNILPKSNINS